MSLLQVRDVPDDVRQVLKARAAARGESLNKYVSDLLRREAERPTLDEVLERAARRTERATLPAAEVLTDARLERARELDAGL
jgi:plasmid stability protein